MPDRADAPEPSASGTAGPDTGTTRARRARSDRPDHVVVLGAGVCGLYAARTLAQHGVLVTVLEAEDVLGGLAATRKIGDNYYDLGVHHLHEFDRPIFDDLRGLMADRMVAVEKSAKIRYGRGYRRYPLEFADLLLGIPPWTLVTALAGLMGQQVRNRIDSSEAHTAEEALIQLYGAPLYHHFFKDFTHRYWGIPPSQLSATFVRRKMPRLSAVDVMKKALGILGLKESHDAAVESALAHETMHYWPTGAQELSQAMARSVEEAAGTVMTSSAVVAVEVEGRRARAVRFARPEGNQRLACDAVLSTIPVPSLIAALDPPPSEAIARSARALQYRPLAVYGLLVRRTRVLDAHYVYFRDRVFHRVAEPTNSGLVVEPPGHSVLLIELTCSLGDDRWSGGETTRRQILEDLQAEGLLAPDEVVEMHHLRTPYGYPVFELGFEPHHAAVTGFLEGIENLRSTGRQGGFTYPNMHEAMRMGCAAAEELLGLDRSADGHAT